MPVINVIRRDIGASSIKDWRKDSLVGAIRKYTGSSPATLATTPAHTSQPYVAYPVPRARAPLKQRSPEEDKQHGDVPGREGE